MDLLFHKEDNKIILEIDCGDVSCEDEDYICEILYNIIDEKSKEIEKELNYSILESELYKSIEAGIK